MLTGTPVSLENTASQKTKPHARHRLRPTSHHAVVGWLLCLFIQLWSAWSSAQPSPGTPTRLTWKIPSPPLSARWSSDGTEIVLHYRMDGLGVIERFHTQRNLRKIVVRSTSAYFPCFGPSQSIFAGTTPTISQLAPPNTRGNSLQKPQASPSETGQKQGIFLYGAGEQQYLFPGTHPIFSESARRLLFSYRDLLYLWDPLKSRQQGLLLLAKGFDPTWTPDGRAIAFLRQPFSLNTQLEPQGGGIWIVDMLFRAAPVSTSGGQVSWAATGRSLAYVDQLATPTKTHPNRRSIPAIFLMHLHRKPPTRQLLRQQAWLPAFSPVPSQQHWLAFVDTTGVWVMDTRTQKALLLYRGASLPQWSSRGELLLVTPRSLVVISWTPALQQRLTQAPTSPR